MSRYAAAVESLNDDRDRAMSVPSEESLLTARRLLAGRPVISIGSGGTLAVAEFGSYLHKLATSEHASTMTPLEFVQSPTLPGNTVVVIYSARAKHPDTALATQHALARGLEVMLITERDPQELGPVFSHVRVNVTTVDSGAIPDGFLATGSVIRMAVAVARMYEFRVPVVDSRPLPGLTDRLLVLYGIEGRPAARDVETRMHELGLATVQLADYRNLAHGRHVGLHRNLTQTTVVALVGDDSRALAERTLAMLPDEAKVVQVQSAHAGPAAAFDLLCAVINLPLSLSSSVELEPSKPRVPPFGRRLYHLPYKRVIPTAPASPVTLKLRAAGALPGNEHAEAYYARSYAEWASVVRRTDFAALLIDYDGTCVETRDRWDPPTQDVKDQLVRVMRGGVRLAFASGRGGSLYEDLRSWVPSDLYAQVTLGLHNGAWRQELADPPAEPTSVHPAIADAQHRLAPLAQCGLVSVRGKPTQISVTPTSITQSIPAVRDLVETALIAGRPSSVRVLASAHSVDVFPLEGGKRAVLEAMQNRDGVCLVIGDQGNIDGNDFDLLHATPFSISVDRTSSDASRCWPVFDSSVKGPEALVRILRAARLRAGVFRYHPPMVKG